MSDEVGGRRYDCRDGSLESVGHRAALALRYVTREVVGGDWVEGESGAEEEEEEENDEEEDEEDEEEGLEEEDEDEMDGDRSCRAALMFFTSLLCLSSILAIATLSDRDSSVWDISRI